MTALVLAAGTAGARVVAPDAGELFGYARALAVFHVRTAVDGRTRILHFLRTPRGEPGRDGRALILGRVPGTPGVGAAAGTAVPLARLGAADPAVPLGRLGTAAGTALGCGPTLGPSPVAGPGGCAVPGLGATGAA